MKYQFLYRALRVVETESGFQLIPKSTNEFKSDPIFGVDSTLPFRFYHEENAVRQHQWKQNGYPTRGVSTTPFIERAKIYAILNRVIVKIDTNQIDSIGI